MSVKVCSNCQVENPTDYDFCFECGTKLGAAVGQSTTGKNPRPASNSVPTVQTSKPQALPTQAGAEGTEMQPYQQLVVAIILLGGTLGCILFMALR